MAGEQSITIDPAFVTAESDESSDDYADSVSEFSTASLASSIYEYRYENGRRYHAYKDGKYAIPNDQAEQDRLDIIHHIYLMLYKGELHMAPINPNPQMILDVGTGTGIWAIDVAERYPSARVIGTDLSPIQPSCIPNVQFQIDDAESEWAFGEDVFDLVHIRHLNGGVKDWGSLVKEAYKAIKPGGWIEIAEYEVRLYSDDGSYSEKTHLWQYYDMVNQAATRIGREFRLAASIDPFIEEAGFIGLKHEQMKIPFGTWPADQRQKEMGAYLLLTADSAFEAFGYALLTRVLGMDIKEVEDVIRLAKKDSKSRKIHTYSMQHVYWAQKPLDDNGSASLG